MNRVAFLLDEHVPRAVARAVLNAEPTTKLGTVGVDDWVPRAGTSDRDLLIFAESKQLLVVTYDKNTMPGHIAVHHTAGRHTWGVIIVPKGKRLFPGVIARELLIVLLASEADEWIDQPAYLP